MRRRLDVFFDGIEVPVGRLESDDYGALRFTYLAEAGPPLSLSLPIQAQPYEDHAARAFFDNLLQENASLEDVMARHGVNRSDIAGLLFHLGRDCPGALSCVPAGEGPGKRPGHLDTDYDELGDDDLQNIMAALRDRRRLPGGTRDPSPLAGVQGKIALTCLPDGRMAIPKTRSGVPTTHILKVPSRSEGQLVDHEHALMVIARQAHRLGAAETAPFSIGDVRGLLITRFDREVRDGRVHRIHQEDFCQALGLPKSLKYERDGQDGRAFNAAAVGHLLGRTRLPAAARLDVLTMTILNLALGNTDNHAKNHALLYRGVAPDLAPLYDIVPVLVDPRVHHDFSFRFGLARAMAELEEADLVRFAADLGLKVRTKTAAAALRGEITRLLQTIAGAMDNLSGPRLKLVGDMVAHQLDALSGLFSLELDLPERDAFVRLGGGFGRLS